MKDILQIKNLTKSYGKARGVSGINLQIEAGTIYGFIGPNGAGKSTTIKCIMNFININEGEIIFDEKKINKKSYRMKEDIGYLPSEINLYEDMKVGQILDYSASFYKTDCTARRQELVRRLEVDESKKIEELSLGNLKKVGIILALMHNPKLVIMDEASSGLDPLMQETFYQILEEEKAKGTTIFFSSHILSEVKRICDRVAIIKEGKIIKIEDMKTLNNMDVVEVTIEARNPEEILSRLNVKTIKQQDDRSVRFIYDDSVNDLIRVISEYNIEKLNIKEVDLEEIFMHYYDNSSAMR